MTAVRISKLLIWFGAAVYPTGLVEAQSTAFTYQGQLKEDGVPANGSYDLAFKLFDAAEDGFQVGTTLTSNGVPVTNGLFEQTLDFGTGAFTGQPRWLEVSANGEVLSPRQVVTATPYAMKTRGIFVNDVGNVGIGTNDTSHRLTIDAPDQETMRLLRSTAGFGFGARLNFGDADYAYIEEDVDDRLLVQANRLALIGGNVGIGTTTPNHLLSITGGPAWTSNSWNGALELSNASAIAWQSNPGGRRFGIGQTEGGLYFFHSASDPGTTASPADYDMVISDSGFVGIGTTTPAYPLTIRTIESIFASGYGWVHTNGTVELGSYLSSGSGWLGTRSNHPLNFFTNDSSALMTLTTAGALGIGTSTVPAGVRLAVNGKVLCEEMEVQLSGDWPDYVFDESYSLIPLSELEKTIEEQNHLPGIPSAAEIAKNGLNVGQMQAQLVEKVEELTLYMIQINKQLEHVERENAELKARLAALEAKP